MQPWQAFLLQQLESVINAAVRLIFSSSKFNHIIPLLSRLHWLKATERTTYDVNMVWHQHTGVTNYANQQTLDVPCTHLSTVGDRAFPVAAMYSLPSHVTAAPLSIFCCRLKSHLFSLSYPTFCLFSHLYTACVVIRHFERYIIIIIFLTL